MAGNTFGKMFRVTTWGESHGKALGAVIDGCPPGLSLSEEDIQKDLDRRRPGRSPASTKRKESDRVQILSGVFEGKTTGTPISLIIYNEDARSGDYSTLADTYRPGHADRTYEQKYGLRDWRGGGRSSARETVARVAAGAVARKFLSTFGINVVAYTLELAGVKCNRIDETVIDNNPFYCPDEEAAQLMAVKIDEIRRRGDSCGGIVQVVARGCPPGLGEPVFDKLDARIAYALMSIGAVKGVEIGSGFRCARMLGSEHNDPITPEGYASNNAGGILGGISSGMDIVARVAVKPIPSIRIAQQTITRDGRPTTITVKGRHDVSAIPRIVPVCEAMMLLVLADFMLHPTMVAKYGFRHT
ncbi:chorismate synthase [Thermodesulforhabdus norvegica]|uniref:Chorismate synthase n=1 Tax=Thermodesulforhabdus norvegica TaxID=39841 RepID=A0A1I4VR66_9BACT|nr:chorismate synthase [Thermodesulforhabdus norvegica]SFN03509.1 chorismate synthase [Thermodesulforhabdus norvegica]